MSDPCGRIEGGEHVLPIRVYYEDTDAVGIVYYANYLKYAERGRTEMLRLVGFRQSDLAKTHGVAFTVRDCKLDFRRPARLDDLIEVRSRLTGLGGATAEAEQVIARDGVALVRLDVRIACVGASCTFGAGVHYEETYGVQLELPNPDYKVPAGLHCEVRLLPD